MDLFGVKALKRSNELLGIQNDKLDYERKQLRESVQDLNQQVVSMGYEYNEVKEAYNTMNDRNYGWESIDTVKGINTDFDLEKHFKMQEKCRESFLFSPLAKRIVKYITSYVTGSEFKIKSENEILQELIDTCVKNPKNKFKRQKREWLHRLLIDGETFVTIHLGKDGSAILREIDPFEIKSILTNPEDKQETILYKRSYNKTIYVDGLEQVGQEVDEYILDISAKVEDIKFLNITPEIQEKINLDKRIQQIKSISFSNRKRGVSELLPILYYLTRVRKDIDQKVQLKGLTGAHYLDVEVDGTANDVAKEMAKEQYKRPPKAGSTLVHNKSVKYSILDPRINNADDNESLKPTMQQVIIGSGMPEWMLTGQSNMYKAGAQEQSAPFAKLIEDLQEMLGDEMIILFTFLISWKLDHNKDRKYFSDTDTKKAALATIDKDGLIDVMKLSDDGKTMVKTGKKLPFWEFIDVQFPDIIVRDQEKESKALTNDMSNGLVSKETAATERGYDYESEKVLMAKEAEEEAARNPLNLDDITNHEDDDKKPTVKKIEDKKDDKQK